MWLSFDSIESLDLRNMGKKHFWILNNIFIEVNILEYLLSSFDLQICTKCRVFGTGKPLLKLSFLDQDFISALIILDLFRVNIWIGSND